jgi:hypothetical protein
MLAMDVNDDVGNLIPRGALRFIASMLAPTGCVWGGWEDRDYKSPTQSFPDRCVNA